jgi:hypothetical protein
LVSQVLSYQSPANLKRRLMIGDVSFQMPDNWEYLRLCRKEIPSH